MSDAGEPRRGRNVVALIHTVTIAAACAAPILLLSVSPAAIVFAVLAAGWWMVRGRADSLLFVVLAALLIVPAGGDDFALRVAGMGILLVAWDLDAVRAVCAVPGDPAKRSLGALARRLPVILAGTAVALIAPMPEISLTPLAGGIVIAAAIVALLLFVTRLDVR